jgi:hypothetical protein
VVYLQARLRAAVIVALLAAAAPAGAAVPRDEIRPWAGVATAGRGTPPQSTQVVVVFRTDPAALLPGAVGSTRATKAAEAAQRHVLRHLARAGFHLTVSVRLTRTVNAVIADVPTGERARLAADPDVLGVFGVHGLVPAGIAADALPSLGPGALPVRSPIGSGAGIEIAVLDGPVDAAHPALAGRVDYPAGATASGAGPGSGHGTAMAALAAGAAGPAGWMGVAPSARILAIQVLTPAADGRLAGTTADLLEGFERAADPNGDGDLADHAGVALAAVSSPFAGFAGTPESMAVHALDHLGTVVVAAAGNDGPTSGRLGSLSAPASAPDALAVGATDGRTGLPQVTMSVQGGNLTDRITVPLVYGLAPVAGAELPLKLFAPSTPPAAGSLNGAAALLPRDRADIRAGALAAAAAGAAAVIVYGDPVPAGSLGVDDALPVAVVSIPASTGVPAADALQAGAAVTVSFGNAGYAANDHLAAVAPFSSTGPGYDGQSKPDLVMPGVAVMSAAPGGTWASITGTSVAAAQAAGMVAALEAVHPDWSADDVRGALVSTAQQMAGPDGGLAPVEEQGGGLPDGAAAAGAGVLVSPATLSFGRVDDGPAHAPLTIRNPGSAPMDVTLAVQRDDVAGDVDVRADPARFVLSPGASLQVPVTLAIGPGGTPDPVVGGWIVIMLGTGASLRVPFSAIAAPADGHALQSVGLSRHTLQKATDAKPQTVTLAVQLGQVALSGDTIDITPIASLEIALRRQGRTTVLYTARDLNPGLYRYSLAARDARGQPLPAGRYTLVVHAVTVDGAQSSRSVALRVK